MKTVNEMTPQELFAEYWAALPNSEKSAPGYMYHGDIQKAFYAGLALRRTVLTDKRSMFETVFGKFP